jgi:hypothetical protein
MELGSKLGTSLLPSYHFALLNEPYFTFSPPLGTRSTKKSYFASNHFAKTLATKEREERKEKLFCSKSFC